MNIMAFKQLHTLMPFHSKRIPFLSELFSYYSTSFVPIFESTRKFLLMPLNPVQ